ncbi:MAG: DUF885 domain-containing protein [Bacteroidota bacterium]|nr:DUF885 domain-containing protein [Bacteroidota bacterium]
MKKILPTVFVLLSLVACNEKTSMAHRESNKDLNRMFDDYYEKRMKLFPLESTQNGESRYNDLLPANISDTYRDTLKNFYNNYLSAVEKYDTSKMDENDLLSYKIFDREMKMQLEALDLDIINPGDGSWLYIPFNQFWGLPITMGQLGAGAGFQPFKTEKDYTNWLSRMQKFSVWCDTAIVQFRKGMQTNFVLPKALVIKMIPQMEAMVVSDTARNIFYGPVKNFPPAFSDTLKKQMWQSYAFAINTYIIPSYKKLGAFLKEEYLPAARTSTGCGALPNGKKIYDYLVRYWTTTNESPEDIYNTGLQQVKQTRDEMEKVKAETGFTGDLPSFFEYLKTDKKFMPYKTPEDVLNAFRNIQKTIDPNLKKMFGRTPKTPFEIRQTEAFRAASASAEYNQGSPDGSRPGIFYIPIMDAAKFNTTSGMESLFLHEAIPGHHYQISLQQENDSLPKFRRFAWYGAMGEGWALYCESLGKELGLYTDPYQYMGALGDDIHRGIRLVVDVSMHLKGMSREEAIKYMTDNEAISDEGATAEIERYMAIPAQALSYKVGALKIRELRNKYAKELGDKFNLAAFHDELLKDGVMPLDVMESKMDAWAARLK